MKEKEMTREERIESFCVDANEVNRAEDITPSGRFKLLRRYYKTKDGCWNYSRGTIYRLSDNKEICDIKRNYSGFFNSFVTKNDQEYLITGRSYMSQTIVNLDTGEEFEPEGDQYNGYAFCWTGAKLSPDGNTLIVEGCHWACPYEYRFFDFTDPSKGWKKLKIDNYLNVDDKEPVFNEDGTIICYQTRKFFIPLNKFEDDITLEEYETVSNEEVDDDDNWVDVECVRYTLKRDGDIIKVLDKWISDDEKERIEKRRIGAEKFKKWQEEFKSSDPLYLTYKKLIQEYDLPVEDYESHGVTYKGWCETFDKEETRWCRRIVKRSNKQPYTVDLNWAVKTGPIKLSIWKDGKTNITKFFEHSAEEMEKAFKYVQNLITKI